MYIFKNTGKNVCYTQFQAQIMYSFKEKKWRNQKEKKKLDLFFNRNWTRRATYFLGEFCDFFKNLLDTLT